MYLGSVTESRQLSKSLNEYDAYDSKLEFATVSTRLRYQSYIQYRIHCRAGDRLAADSYKIKFRESIGKYVYGKSVKTAKPQETRKYKTTRNKIIKI